MDALTLEPRVLRFVLRERERARFAQFDLRMYASKLLVLRPQLARQSTAVHRGRRPSRWRSGISQGTERLQPARHRARTSEARVLCFLLRER